LDLLDRFRLFSHAQRKSMPPVSSPASSAFPRTLSRSASPLCPSKRFMTDRVFETAAIPLCSGPQVCSPPRSFLPLRLIVARSRGFYVRAEHASLPPHASDTLTNRSGNCWCWRVERLFAGVQHFRRLVIRRKYPVETSSAWSAWGARKSCLGINERLLKAQRHHGINSGRATSGNVAGEKGRSEQRHCHRTQGNRVDGAHSIKQAV